MKIKIPQEGSLKQFANAVAESIHKMTPEQKAEIRAAKAQK